MGSRKRVHRIGSKIDVGLLLSVDCKSTPYSAPKVRPMMREEIKDPLFEKIELLIGRNDFVTAEKMLKKYEAALTPAQREQLQGKMSKQQKAKAKNAKKALRRQKYGVYWDQIFTWTERLLFCFWGISAIILAPYGKMYYFTTLSSWDGPPFQHNFMIESLFLLCIFLAIVYCVVKFFINHQGRKIQQEGMIKFKDRDNVTFGWYDTLEKAYANQDKNWLIALSVFLLLFIIHLVNMVMRFAC